MSGNRGNNPAATRRFEAERKLEEARIRRLELELGLTTTEAIEEKRFPA